MILNLILGSLISGFLILTCINLHMVDGSIEKKIRFLFLKGTFYIGFISFGIDNNQLFFTGGNTVLRRICNKEKGDEE